MTPTLARMVGARAQALAKPIKWFSIPQLFRYERPQRGRLREHFQLNMDIVGEAGVMADAELVAAGVDALRYFGLDESDFVARVSDRQLIGLILREVGVPPESLVDAISVLDRSERQEADWLVERFAELGVEEAGLRRILRMREQGLDELGEEFAGSADIAEAIARLHAFFGLIDEYGLSAFVTFDPRLVRGLAYYTGIVFELWERRGRLRAICGGGRYNDLLAALGGPDMPALGFGMGDVVLGELLKEKGLAPESISSVEDFVVYVTHEQRPAAIRLVRQLRERGRSAGLDFRGRSVGRQFRAADQAGARRVIVIGPDEEETGSASVRDMETGNEQTMTGEDVLVGPIANGPAQEP
jgi:histidyl-tRNA synthetase